MAKLGPILKITKGFEGGDSDHPSDTGGRTRFGITQWRYTAAGYWGSVKNCTPRQAYNIYKKYYWDPLKLWGVEDDYIALIMFDTRVNGGKPVKWLQRTLNVLNARQKRWEDMKVDGKMGPTTVRILHKALRTRKSGVSYKELVYQAMESFRTMHFIKISEKRELNEDFTPGWIDKRVLGLRKKGRP